jgi:hypothetical protein
MLLALPPAAFNKYLSFFNVTELLKNLCLASAVSPSASASVDKFQLLSFHSSHNISFVQCLLYS